ncbi:MAG: type 1 glutamine amidotransferase domain-containing protein [Litorilinea sp.]
MSIQGMKIAILVEDVYETLELWYPYYRLIEAGAQVTLVGPEQKSYASKEGYPAQADVAAEAVSADDFDGIVVPGGFAPDKLRRYPAVLDLVRGIDAKRGLVAAICHAGWVPISAGILRGKRMTCVAAIKDDAINAGANYVDEEVVVDGNLVTSRTPADLPAFMPAILRVLEESRTPVRA